MITTVAADGVPGAAREWNVHEPRAAGRMSITRRRCWHSGHRATRSARGGCCRLASITSCAESELALLQEEERAQHRGGGIDSVHLAVDTKSSIELDSSIEQLVVSSACPRRPSDTNDLNSEPTAAATGGVAVAPSHIDATSGIPARLQSVTRQPQRMDIGEWVNRLQGADARRAEYLASRQRKARRGARGLADEPVDSNERDVRRDVRRSATGAKREASPHPGEKRRLSRRRSQKHQARGQAPGRGDVIAKWVRLVQSRPHCASTHGQSMAPGEIGMAMRKVMAIR